MSRRTERLVNTISKFVDAGGRLSQVGVAISDQHPDATFRDVLCALKKFARLRRQEGIAVNACSQEKFLESAGLIDQTISEYRLQRDKNPQEN